MATVEGYQSVAAGVGVDGENMISWGSFMEEGPWLPFAAPHLPRKVPQFESVCPLGQSQRPSDCPFLVPPFPQQELLEPLATTWPGSF